MTLTAAITVNVAPHTLVERLPEAEPPINEPGSVTVSTRAAPGDRGTELRITWEIDGPTGIGRVVATVTGDDPQRRLDDTLRRFKQLVETGEVLRSDSSPGGTDAHDQRHQRPAQPAGDTDAPGTDEPAI